MGKKDYDVIIVGAGIMGACTAYYLMKANDKLHLAVIERDPTYTRASTTLSMANVRVQFGLKENIQISQYALQVFETFAEDMEVDGDKPDIGHQKIGNLFLVNEEGEEVRRKNLALQLELGCNVEWWPPETIVEHYPLYNPEGYVGGTFGPDDGIIDPYALLMAYVKKAKSLGAQFIKGEVKAMKTKAGQVEGVVLFSGEQLSAPIVVNCAGAWAPELARTAGIDLPVIPVMRQVFALDTADKPEGPLPLTILPSGLYFRTETGSLILLGKSMQDDTVGYDFKWDDKRFMEILWPELAEFVPAFDTLKLVRGWAGLYAVSTLDENAFIGEWPELKGYFMANGFSGHGLQQGPAVGRYLSQLILGLPPTLDLSIFSPQRILDNRPIAEDVWAIV
ncbi:MAG: FAD-binding oxidoreductase [Deltaproteobacteria bacterium]|nr:FAD-binding oxidoreductase [Deltaproteobacteria bacterium]MBW2082256.1 FAD-binding oxidoreductase [Deltaproteobacteria bacterium]HDM09022.1 FAD-binding oxidoreductase [Desulfobacteraceae bacterium]